MQTPRPDNHLHQRPEALRVSSRPFHGQDLFPTRWRQLENPNLARRHKGKTRARVTLVEE